MRRSEYLRPLVVLPILFSFLGACSGPRKNFPILDAHVHIQSLREAPSLLGAMDRLGIEKTILLASPAATFDPRSGGFRDYEANNREVLEIARRYPDRFLPFVTLDPLDPLKLEKFKQDLASGAQGLKLYTGHQIFHERPLDDPGMEEIYAFCESQKIPVIFHVNAGFFEEEFHAVLKKFPRMKVVCPHFCLSTIATDRFERLMENHPNLYTDLSFGPRKNLETALERFSRNPEKYRRLILRYQDRILFGTDAVVTSQPGRGEEWLLELGKVYRSLLEEKDYDDIRHARGRRKGLYLPAQILRKIYYSNIYQFIAK